MAELTEGIAVYARDPKRKGEQAPCGVDTVRDLEARGSTGGPAWKAEFGNVPSLVNGRAIADRVAAEGGAAHVWQDGDLVYKAYSIAYVRLWGKAGNAPL